MDGMFVLFLLGAIIGGSILAWTYTKSGKRWLKNL